MLCVARGFGFSRQADRELNGGVVSPLAGTLSKPIHPINPQTHLKNGAEREGIQPLELPAGVEVEPLHPVVVFDGGGRVLRNQG